MGGDVRAGDDGGVVVAFGGAAEGEGGGGDVVEDRRADSEGGLVGEGQGRKDGKEHGDWRRRWGC